MWIRNEQAQFFEVEGNVSLSFKISVWLNIPKSAVPGWMMALSKSNTFNYIWLGIPNCVNQISDKLSAQIDLVSK